MRILTESKIGKLDSRRVMTQVVVILTCLVLVVGGVTWRASLKTCKMEIDASVRHVWVKEYTYKSVLFDVGIQSVDTMYLTQNGKNEVYACKIK